MTLAEEIKEKRQSWSLTQKQMAKRIGVSLATYQNLETFQGGYSGTFPSATTVQKLKQAKVIKYSYREVIEMLKNDRRHHQGRRKK